MAPELRKRKPKEAIVSAAKPVSKAKNNVLATKRKAADDASPVAPKKSKPTKEDGRSKKAKPSSAPSKEKKTSKSAPPTEMIDKDGEESNDEADNVQLSDNEQDDARALAKTIDSDGEEDDVADTDAAFQEGQDVGKIPKASKKSAKSSKSGDGERGIVYVGRLPHGFYEHEMRSYFSQFGKIERLRMSRNKKTGASKHFAFIEFAEASVAKVVADTMDNYLLFGRILKVKVVPESQIHEDLWKGSNKRFKKVPWNKIAGNQLKKPISESAWAQKITKEEQKRSERAKKLLDMDYDFEGPKIKSVEDVAKDTTTLEGDSETPKAIEEAPKAAEVEARTVEKEVKDGGNDAPDSELAVEKPTKANKKGAIKTSKKVKKSSRTKKAAT